MNWYQNGLLGYTALTLGRNLNLPFHLNNFQGKHVICPGIILHNYGVKLLLL